MSNISDLAKALQELVPRVTKEPYTPNPDPDTKWCPTCREHRPLTEFYQGKNGPGSYCKTHQREYQRSRPKNFRSRRGCSLRKNYGLTHEQYDAMFAAQDGKCAICGQAETKRDNRTGEIRWLCVDHDHTTGQVRGLLCVACNSALGQLQEDPGRIAARLRYAERIHQQKENAA